MPSLIIEGWRFIPHSFAVVNQFQCLQMLNRPELEIFHRDVPFHVTAWRPTPDLFTAEAEQRLHELPAPGKDQPADALLRISTPFNLDKSEIARTWTLGNANFGVVTSANIRGKQSLLTVMQASNVNVITPSNWSRNGFINSGVAPDRVKVVPHGIDPQIFRPVPAEERSRLRKRYGWSESFVFLTVGAMTDNKNVPMLLRAFAKILQRFPHGRLVLKGIDSLYPSNKFCEDALRSLTPSESNMVLPRMMYMGAPMSFLEMASLYQAADAYVSPYMAEGFNMPVLEAMACGLPPICTSGGATDDFTRHEFALRIDSERKTLRDRPGFALVPNEEHLVTLMEQAIEDTGYMGKARTAAAEFAVHDFTWKHVVDRLCEVLFTGSG